VIPLSVLTKPSSWCFDIVVPADTRTACFTKAYSRYARGTGSVLSSAGWVLPAQEGEGGGGEDSSPAPLKRPRIEEQEGGAAGGTAQSCTGGEEKACREDREDREDRGGEGGEGVGGEKRSLSEEQIRTLRLRYFSPRELLRLFGFPEAPSFCFPPGSVPRRKAYELIGNSLNVDVAAHLIEFLLENTSTGTSTGTSTSTSSIAAPTTCCNVP
jgi:site-specific DNA-cytosine methylase